jgi:hypothetical protein
VHTQRLPLPLRIFCQPGRVRVLCGEQLPASVDQVWLCRPQEKLCKYFKDNFNNSPPTGPKIKTKAPKQEADSWDQRSSQVPKAEPMALPNRSVGRLSASLVEFSGGPTATVGQSLPGVRHRASQRWTLAGEWRLPPLPLAGEWRYLHSKATGGALGALGVVAHNNLLRRSRRGGAPLGLREVAVGGIDADGVVFSRRLL